MNAQNLLAALRTLEFCREMHDDDLARLAAISHERDYHRGDVLFREGDPASDLYLIVRGEVGLSVHAPRVGDRYVMSVGSGEMIGWSTVLGRNRMTDTARATAPTSAVIVDGGALLTLCQENPSLGWSLMRRTAQAIAERLSATRLKLLDMCGLQLPTIQLESD